MGSDWNPDLDFYSQVRIGLGEINLLVILTVVKKGNTIYILKWFKFLFRLARKSCPAVLSIPLDAATRPARPRRSNASSTERKFSSTREPPSCRLKFVPWHCDTTRTVLWLVSSGGIGIACDYTIYTALGLHLVAVGSVRGQFDTPYTTLIFDH